MSPVSTNTQVSWLPMARCVSAAATALSTPPDSPQMARALPTWARMASMLSVMTLAIVHSELISQMPCRKRSSCAWPLGVCITSGWYCTP